MVCVVCSKRRRDGLVWLASSRRRRTGLVWLACSPEEGAVCSSPSQPASDQMVRLTSSVTRDMVVGNQPMYCMVHNVVTFPVEWNFRLKGQCHGILDSKLFLLISV
jgi:hypothetical protein